MSVSTNSYFMDTRATPAALSTLCSLYVHRTYHCWKEPEVRIKVGHPAFPHKNLSTLFFAKINSILFPAKINPS